MLPLGESRSAFDVFDAIWCFNRGRDPARWAAAKPRLMALGLAGRVRRPPPTLAPADGPIARALAHRHVVAAAQAQGSGSLLVVDDDVLFLDRTFHVMQDAAPELMRTGWSVCYLGGNRPHTLPPVPGCARLVQTPGVMGSYAVAYHARTFGRLLAEWPPEPAAMAEWIAAEESIDRWLLRLKDAVMVQPTVASKGMHLPFEAPELQFRFTV